MSISAINYQGQAKYQRLGRRYRFLVFVGALISSRWVMADDVPSTFGTGSIWQVLLSLGLVLAVIFLLAWLARKLPLNLTGGQGELKVISSVSLGGRERATVVEFSGKKLLLGVAQGNVTLLAEQFLSEDTSGHDSELTNSGGNVGDKGNGNRKKFRDALNRSITASDSKS